MHIGSNTLFVEENYSNGSTDERRGYAMDMQNRITAGSGVAAGC
jgi:hypothetical protein